MLLLLLLLFLLFFVVFCVFFCVFFVVFCVFSLGGHDKLYPSMNTCRRFEFVHTAYGYMQ